jgi:hypothetical protein
MKCHGPIGTRQTLIPTPTPPTPAAHAIPSPRLHTPAFRIRQDASHHPAGGFHLHRLPVCGAAVQVRCMRTARTAGHRGGPRQPLPGCHQAVRGANPPLIPNPSTHPKSLNARRPYVRLLHEESKDIAGLLSQLPAEVAIEDIAKNIVIVSFWGCGGGLGGGAWQRTHAHAVASTRKHARRAAALLACAPPPEFQTHTALPTPLFTSISRACRRAKTAARRRLAPATHPPVLAPAPRAARLGLSPAPAAPAACRPAMAAARTQAATRPSRLAPTPLSRCAWGSSRGSLCRAGLGLGWRRPWVRLMRRHPLLPQSHTMLIRHSPPAPTPTPALLCALPTPKHGFGLPGLPQSAPCPLPCGVGCAHRAARASVAARAVTCLAAPASAQPPLLFARLAANERPPATLRPDRGRGGPSHRARGRVPARRPCKRASQTMCVPCECECARQGFLDRRWLSEASRPFRAALSALPIAPFARRRRRCLGGGAEGELLGVGAARFTLHTARQFAAAGAEQAARLRRAAASWTSPPGSNHAALYYPKVFRTFCRAKQPPAR